MSEVLTWDGRRAIRKLTPAQKRNLMALPSNIGGYATVAEMRAKGATGSNMDILYIMHFPKLSERRWTRWGDEKGQKPSEGYEYTITEFGQRIRSLVVQEELL
ncbi:hypothetical protein [Sphingomonas sp.]|uniref:hypothetical protein n=1 Tax=Sphingomonas sp. TaxID=28214 RepID=UPI002898D33B|nr:hypothetical protein [Sphingomonas sp.]